MTSAALLLRFDVVALNALEIADRVLNVGSTVPASILAMMDWLTPAASARAP